MGIPFVFLAVMFSYFWRGIAKRALKSMTAEVRELTIPKRALTAEDVPRLRALFAAQVKPRPQEVTAKP